MTRARARKGLLNALRRVDDTLQTGFVGTPFLCRELSAMGRDDLSYALLLREDYPSWLYEVKLGATTVWERWNSLLPDGSISSTGMNSLNHYAYGSILEWMFARIGGIRPWNRRLVSGKPCFVPRPTSGWVMARRSCTPPPACGNPPGSWKMVCFGCPSLCPSTAPAIWPCRVA